MATHDVRCWHGEERGAHYRRALRQSRYADADHVRGEESAHRHADSHANSAGDLTNEEEAEGTALDIGDDRRAGGGDTALSTPHAGINARHAPATTLVRAGSGHPTDFGICDQAI